MSDETGVPEGVLKLIQRYEAFRQIYLKGEYNETQLRREFVDPFFRALGWDVDNNQGFSEAYKDVVHEQTIKFRGHDTNTKFIDYAFRLGGVMKFIVETKKPSSKIAEDARSALQVRRYGWNAKLSLNILTNFEEWSVYDCRIKPENSDPATKGRIKYFTYKDIAKEWDYLSSVFTKSAIQKGSFDAYAVETKGKKGTASVDDTFLAEIEEWRDRLAKNLALRNPTLSVDELNDAVQKTIDRIIFLRICEDRGIEKYETLKNVLDGEGTYTKLCALFLDADERYNSGLFHFREEKGNPEMPDGYTLTLTIDDKVLKDLIKRLYYPDCPFEFSVLPTAILGHVYEQFLGKVIRLTEGHQAKVEYKPEVKKAGGVFYTPEYIVDYIVEHTVGELIKGKTPKEVSKIRVLDPACGSGSFLLGAYDKLLDWHRDWYIENLVPVLKEKGETSPEVKALVPPDARGAENLPVYKASNGTDSRVRSDWNLTTAERKRILLNNIYGVDIDRQAVEVTKLSLLLKVLEEENEETVSKQLKLFKERALPSLHENIKCGNSLIGSDIYQDVQVALDDPTVIKRINAFDWDVEFSEIMKGGGFDAVIGNPPWGAEFSTNEQANIRKNFKVASGRNLDSYAIFIEAGLKKLRKGGLLSYITPDTFLRKDDHYELRSLLLNDFTINELVETGPVFSKVRDTWALVFLLSNQKSQPNSKISHKNLSRFIVSAEQRLERFHLEKWDNNSMVSQELWKSRPYCVFGYLASENDQVIIAKIELNKRLLELSEIFSISRGEEGSKFLLKETIDGNFFMVIPKDVGRYTIEPGLKISDKTLTPNKVVNFYQYPKIWIIRIQKMRWKQRLVCTLDERSNSSGMKTLQVIVSAQNDIQNLKYLQGILSSTLMNYYLVNYLSDDINKSYIEKIPIRVINHSDLTDAARHTKMVTLVERMLDLNKSLPMARTDQDQTMIKRQIAATDKEIDELVYELYGLTAEERKIVSGLSQSLEFC